MAVRRVEWWRRRARRECRNGRRCLGWLAEGAKRAGERRVGIIRRWMVVGGEEAIAWVMDWRTEGKGSSAMGEMAVKLMATEVGSESRLVKSKL